MKKLLPITLVASATTFGLFAFMAFLISNDDASMIIVEEYPVVNVYQEIKETPPMDKPKPVLTPPPPAPVPKTLVAMTDPIDTNIIFDYQPPVVSLTGADTMGTINAAPDNDARPVVRINPKYPMEAARSGIEGWVVLSFSIDEIGQVNNVSVINAEPKRIFDQAAKQALKKWKYRAKMLNGQPVTQDNLTVQLDFVMNEQS